MIRVGKHIIGRGEPFIIAEVGSNWRTLDDCLTSVRLAKHAGANAVKFQLFTEKSLFGFLPNGLDVDVRGTCPYLNPAWLPSLKAEADDHDIEFMCSAFSPEELSLVDPFVNVHKIASSEMYHTRLLQAANRTGKPVILSTAAATLPDIQMALSLLDVPTIVLYCVGAYPAKVIDLRVMRELQGATGKLVGYSDHSTDAMIIPTSAVILGASVIEKHFTAITAETPDSGHSLTLNEFKLMVEMIRGTIKPPYIGPTANEADMISRHKRRLIAIKDINPGDTLIDGFNFGIFRSRIHEWKAMTPFAVDHVNRKSATKAIAAGEGIGPEDFL